VTCHVNRSLEELFLTLLWKVLCKLPEPWKTSELGRPPYTTKSVTAACIAKLMLDKTYEGTEAWTKANKLFRELTGYEGIPQSVIHRGMEKLSKRHIKLVCRRLTIEFRRKGIEAVIDATGLKLRTSSAWYDIRIGRKTKKKDFLKLHIIGCFRTGLIHSFTVTGGRSHDSPQLKVLLSVIQKVLKMAGDSAYLSRPNCTLVKEKGGKPFFMVKCNVTARPKSHPAWKAMVRFYWEDKKQWLREYHIRSYAEAIFAAIKKRFGNFLRSIRRDMQEKELSLKVVCYNIVRVLYLRAAKELGVPLWVKVRR